MSSDPSHLREAVFASLAELVAIELPFKVIVGDAKRIFSRWARDARAMETAIVVIVSGKKIANSKRIDRTVRTLARMRAVAAVCVVERSAERFVFKSEKSITKHDIPAATFRRESTTTPYDMPAVRLSWDDRPVHPSVSDTPDVKLESKTSVAVDEIHFGAGDTGAHPKISRRLKSSRRHFRSRKAVKLESAAAFLTEVLANGPVPTSELTKLAQDAGIAGMTLRRAAERLRLVKKRGRWRLAHSQPNVLI